MIIIFLPRIAAALVSRYKMCRSQIPWETLRVLLPCDAYSTLVSLLVFTWGLRFRARSREEALEFCVIWVAVLSFALAVVFTC